MEDDTFLCNMYATKLRSKDFVVFIAHDGKTGMEYVYKEKPDMILLDIMMPKLNGYNVIKEMKSKKATKNIPIVLLTNLSQKRHVEKGIALGATDYLVKAHFMPTEVINRIKKIANDNIR